MCAESNGTRDTRLTRVVDSRGVSDVCTEGVLGGGTSRGVRRGRGRRTPTTIYLPLTLGYTFSLFSSLMIIHDTYCSVGLFFVFTIWTSVPEEYVEDIRSPKNLPTDSRKLEHVFLSSVLKGQHQ